MLCIADDMIARRFSVLRGMSCHFCHVTLCLDGGLFGESNSLEEVGLA